jgi:hypothetical protein
MSTLVPFIWAAGAVQFGLASANFSIRAKLRYQENASRMSLIMQQVSIVHWAYMAGVLLAFSGLCFLFAPQLASGSPLGRYLCATLAIFWLSRCAVQLFYYDKNLRRQNRLADVVFLLAFFYMGAVFAVATFGGVQ